MRSASFDVYRGRQGRSWWKTVKSAELSPARLPSPLLPLSPPISPLSASRFSFPMGPCNRRKAAVLRYEGASSGLQLSKYASPRPPPPASLKQRNAFRTLPKTSVHAETSSFVLSLKPQEFGAWSLNLSSGLLGF